jgi:RNA polymerase sigma factor (TIGR02999 family)
MNDVSRILSAVEQGDNSAAADLWPLIYDELRRLAAHQLAQESPGQTLQATALVHEAYLRLVDEGQSLRWTSRRHFFAAAAQAMRRILIENARRKQRLKRGSELVRTEFDEQLAIVPEVQEDLVALDAALTRFAATDRVACELVELRYFGGLSIAEAAESLGLAPRTADRMWSYARAWLHREIQGAAGAADNS